MSRRCNWTKIGKEYHAGAGPRGFWKVTREGKRYIVYRRGGATGPGYGAKGWQLYTSSKSLKLAKQAVGFHLNCKA